MYRGRRRAGTCLVALLALATAGAGIWPPPRAQGAASAPNDDAFELQWAHPLIGVQQAWETGRGAGATVAILDTGVDYSHEDLEGRLLQGRNFVRRDRTATDDNGQGTHLAGIVAAVADNRKGIAGIAPLANVLPVKVLDHEDEADESDVLDGIAYAIERRASVLLLELDRDVNLSEDGAVFRKAIEDAFAAGVLPVLAAEHPFLLSPGFATAPALVVAGLNREGKQPTYDHADGVGAARWGLAAPSGAGDGSENDILSTMWPHVRQAVGQPPQEFGRYAYDADNAQAAAHVAGAAAILRGLGQSPQQSVDRLLASARDAGPPGRDPTFGSGVLDVAGSVEGLTPARPARSATTVATPAPASGRPGTPPASADGTPAEPAEPAVEGSGPPAPADPAAPSDPSSGDDVVGGLAAAGDPQSGRVPVIPLVVFLLLFGSATITWALRRRTSSAD